VIICGLNKKGYNRKLGEAAVPRKGFTEWQTYYWFLIRFSPEKVL
jgi:hypothetical protein